ncbi:TetR/AcrR family transcriptional regulator [Azospirillum sp. sgz302134]
MARRIGLTPARVLDEAVALADAEGLSAVTLARLAERLGVRSPSLYAHVAGLDGLQRDLALRAARVLKVELAAAMQGRSGMDGLRAIARAYRAFAHAHPGLYEATQRAVTPGDDPELSAAFLEVVELVGRPLRQRGLGGDDVVHAVRALRSALHGFITLERAHGFGLSASIDESFDRMVELLIAGLQG